jgi:hypothetical protein
VAEERSEFAPADQTPRVAPSDLLARVQRRMRERDNEELAIEQLPAAGRADDPGLGGPRVPATEPPQERAAALTEPRARAAATPTRLRELQERIEELRAQLKAAPTRAIERLEHFEERALTLSSQREQITARLAALPEPGRRFGRERDPRAIERAQLTSALDAHDRELRSVAILRSDFERELGDPAEIQAQRNGLERAIANLGKEEIHVRDELADREVRAPGTWAPDTLAQRRDSRGDRERYETTCSSCCALPCRLRSRRA